MDKSKTKPYLLIATIVCAIGLIIRNLIRHKPSSTRRLALRDNFVIMLPSRSSIGPTQTSAEYLTKINGISYSVKIASFNAKTLLKIDNLASTACFIDALNADFYGIQEGSFPTSVGQISNIRNVTSFSIRNGKESEFVKRHNWYTHMYIPNPNDPKAYNVGVALGSAPTGFVFDSNRLLQAQPKANDSRGLLSAEGYFKNKNHKFLFATMTPYAGVGATAINEKVLDSFFKVLARSFLKTSADGKFVLIGPTGFDVDEMKVFIERMEKKHGLTLNMPSLPKGKYSEATLLNPSSTKSLDHLITNAVVESYDLAAPLCSVHTKPIVAKVKLNYTSPA